MIGEVILIVLAAIVDDVRNPSDKDAIAPHIAKEIKENNAMFKKKCQEWIKSHP